ncbi:MAG: response regulator [Campylobacterota bacterium]|nr:response regulator [Campylobacterota bacterium]
MDINKFKSLNVLYVEDEIELRDVTCNSLESIIPNISVAGNGKEGLEVFNSDDEFDLIVTDLAMPVMSGTEMIKIIRETNSNIPILVTTAFGSQNEEIIELEKIGIEGYIMKPVDMMKLIQKIDEIIK